MDTDQIYARFIDIKMAYANRNATLDGYSTFFEGTQWDTAPEDMEEELRGEEEIRLTFNYARKSVLWHVGLLTGKVPRVDVPVLTAVPNPSVLRREQYLRAIVACTDFRRAHRRLEVSANKYGYGVFQALWKPEDGQPTDGKYTRQPFLFRALNPRTFYPVYRTYDTPNNFLYVFRHDPDRLVEDIEEQYNVVLAPTEWTAGERGLCDLVEYWDNKKYVLIALTSQMGEEDEEETVVPTVLMDKAHPYGRPPFFVLPNFVSDPDKDPTDGGCMSEVELIEGVNKHLNLIVSLLGSEIATRVHPPIVYKSDEPQQDPANIRIGAGEVIPIGLEEEIIPLRWEGVPQTVAEHRDALMQALRDFSGLPNTALGSQGSTSGIGMRMAYAVLEMILPLKIPERCDFLFEVLSFVLEVTESQLRDEEELRFWASQEATAILSKADIQEHYFCSVQYGNLIPKNRIEEEQHTIYLHKTGLVSLHTALEMLEEIPDPSAEIERIKRENQDIALNPEKAGLIRQLQQPTPQPESPSPPASAGMPEEMGLKNDAAPPVPQLPSMPTQQNAPFLERGAAPPMGAFRPGVHQGPPIEEGVL